VVCCQRCKRPKQKLKLASRDRQQQRLHPTMKHKAAEQQGRAGEAVANIDCLQQRKAGCVAVASAIRGPNNATNLLRETASSSFCTRPDVLL
jgi:predicted metal-binding protein